MAKRLVDETYSTQLCDDEIYLRTHCPEFFERIVREQARFLEKGGNPELILMFKEGRQARDEQWRQLQAEKHALSETANFEEAELQKSLRQFRHEVRLDPPATAPRPAGPVDAESELALKEIRARQAEVGRQTEQLLQQSPQHAPTLAQKPKLTS